MPVSPTAPHSNIPQPFLSSSSRFLIGLKCGLVLLVPIILLTVLASMIPGVRKGSNLLFNLELFFIFTYLACWCGLQGLMTRRFPAVVITLATFIYTLASPFLWIVTYHLLDRMIHGTPIPRLGDPGGLGGPGGIKLACNFFLWLNVYYLLTLLLITWRTRRAMARQLADRLLAPIETDRMAKTFTTHPGKTTVYIVRPQGMPQDKIPVLLDGEPLASLPPGTFLHLELEPGSHQFLATHRIDSRLDLLTEPGKCCFILLAIRTPQDPLKRLLAVFRDLRQVQVCFIPEADGRATVQRCRLLGAPAI